jgi:hypothetical protein
MENILAMLGAETVDDFELEPPLDFELEPPLDFELEPPLDFELELLELEREPEVLLRPPPDELDELDFEPPLDEPPLDEPLELEREPDLPADLEDRPRPLPPLELAMNSTRASRL